MKNNRINRIIDILITTFMMLNAFSITFATGTVTGSDAVDGILEEVIHVLLTVAGFVSLGVLLVIGIKFMVSSAEEKSNAKTAILPWLIGTVVCFGASWIGGTIVDILRVDGKVLDM